MPFRTRRVAQRLTELVGIVNITPDSFADGGRWLDPSAAMRHAAGLVADGASVIDLGAESTRPGAAPADAEGEWRRLEPVLTGLRSRWSRGTGPLLSVDTRHPATARRAVEATLPASRRRALHAAVLGALRGATWPADLARLAHHAEGAENAEQVLALLPAAAGQAAALGAHREAARHYRTALTYADALSHEERAVLLEGLAYESYLTGQIAEAHEARSAALLLWRQLGRREQEGATLRWLSRLSWFLARRDDAYRYAAEAIALLEQLPPGEELAMAYTNRSQIHMLSYETGEAVAWGERALALATALDAAAIRAHALNNIGTAIFYEDGARGLALLGESLRLALEYGLEEHVARAYTNLGSGGVVARDYGAAMAALEEGIAYCIERDLDSWELYMRAWRARARLETGDWDGAVEEARAILSRPQAPAVSRIPALAALGRTLARRGDAAAGPALDEARELAAQTGELQRIAPVAVARAEACWLRGAAEGCRAELRPALALADDGTNHWERGELQLWLWRAGAGAGQPDLPDVISREIAGDWRGAARAWEQLGCPYERALALAAGDAEALRLAQGLLGQLGAAPALAIVQRRMRDRGLSGIPRGPRQSTQANPAQLTQRQIEVLRLVADGLQNGAIAERLHITAKTVDHHLAAIFAKLAVRSRAQAVAAAARLGLLAES
ncbi:MAG TPA: dihydropteroate synthase [Chloroflexaceae bacterium]|nr:dihydropteroate synthase [Chloroflexaceae bacterium]